MENQPIENSKKDEDEATLLEFDTPPLLKKAFSSPTKHSNNQTVGLYKCNPRMGDYLPQLDQLDSKEDQQSSQNDQNDSQQTVDNVKRKESEEQKDFNSSKSKIAYQAQINQFQDAQVVEDELQSHTRMQFSKQIQTDYQKSEMSNRVFEEKIQNNISQFAKDKYNHFILVLVLDNGLIGHKKWILDKILVQLDQLSINQFGYKIVQRCLEVSKKEAPMHYEKMAQQILSDDNNFCYNLQINQYGNYVIQKCLEVFDDQNLYSLLTNINRIIMKNEKVNDSFLKQNDLCSDQYGCLVIQKLVEVYKSKKEGQNKKMIEQMINQILSKSDKLATSQFSNYVIQQIIEKGASQFKNKLLTIIVENFSILSKDKYGSNVAEKSIIFADMAFRIRVWDKIHKEKHESKMLINDKFSNYVIQRLYEYGDQSIKEDIEILVNEMGSLNELDNNGMHVSNFIDNMNGKTHNQQRSKHIKNRYQNQFSYYPNYGYQGYPNPSYFPYFQQHLYSQQ